METSRTATELQRYRMLPLHCMAWTFPHWTAAWFPEGILQHNPEQQRTQRMAMGRVLSFMMPQLLIPRLRGSLIDPPPPQGTSLAASTTCLLPASDDIR